MRNIYLKMLYDFAQKDDRVVSLVADNGVIVYDNFMNDFPDRFYNFGISEGHMVSAAAGMASCGLIPYVYTVSAFLAYRSYEFIRDDVCYQNQNVKIVGIGTGLTYSTLGPSHHTTEDIALLRSLPNLTVFSPATREEVKWVMKQSYEIEGPVYIRLSNNNEEYYQPDQEFELGVPTQIKQGTGIVIFVTGSIASVAVHVANKFEEQGIHVAVYSVHTLKPLAEGKIAKLLANYEKIVILEEHNMIGGLYSAFAEVMLAQKMNKPVLNIGLNDQFAMGYGTIGEVRKANGLDEDSVYRKIKEYISQEK